MQAVAPLVCFLVAFFFSSPAAPSSPLIAPAPFAAPMRTFLPRRPIRAEIERLHRASRERMIAALSAAHRALVGRIIGDLAVAETPDIPDAIKRIDAALSPREARTIVAVQNDEYVQVERIIQASLPQTRLPTRKHGEYMRRFPSDPANALFRSLLLIASYEQPAKTAPRPASLR